MDELFYIIQTKLSEESLSTIKDQFFLWCRMLAKKVEKIRKKN